MSGNRTELGSKYDDRNVVIYTHRVNEIEIETKNNTTGTSEFAFLTAEQAYALHDFIAEHITRPKSPTGLEQFQALPVGAGVTYGYLDSTRIKISDTRFYSSETRRAFEAADNIRDTDAVTEVVL